jgi:hypothetical protein
VQSAEVAPDIGWHLILVATMSNLVFQGRDYNGAG